ncbi:hypothetical protein C1I95_06020 [Micromonospora craterilacus]|uniref:Uncharacterized protein n=1 Tax=Micromonospora craterilacus TaxID=1655439 RepID=A0A2W2ED85_9ACTN|nr:hypothetical protein C1I95_06020 [Micromonospora craterilacus]
MVKAELVVEVTDHAALEQAALDDIDATPFRAPAGHSVADVRAEARQDVQGDPAGAVAWLVHVDDVIADVPGVVVVDSTQQVFDGESIPAAVPAAPDFATLFPLCRCGKGDCTACSGYQLTPRTSMILWAVAQILADQAYDDVNEHGDAPVIEEGEWSLLASYPRITWRQDAVWRRQAARAFDDLTGDLEAGRIPTPTCPGEEMALHLILRAGQDAHQDGWGVAPSDLARLPSHPDDYDWDITSEVLLEDDDILNLFDAQLDGVEDPDSEYNRSTGMGDYRPAVWFRPFPEATPRDGRRPFRR